MNFIRFSATRKVTISMLYALLFLLGYIAWNKLPREYMPNIEFPQLVVLTSYENASSQEVENLVTKTIEEACGTVKGVRRIHSTSKEGISIVTVEFIWGVDMDFASLNLREKIDLVKVKLPREAGEPRIEKFNPFALPVMVLSLTGNKPPQELLKVAQRPVSELIEKVPGVAAVSITGGLEREIQVEVDQSKLSNRQIPIISVVDSIAQANITYPAGSIQDNTYEYEVRVVGSFEKPTDIENVIVKVDRESMFPSDTNSREGEKKQRRKRSDSSSPLIFMSSLGTVTDSFKERQSYARYDGMENVTLAVLKQGEANIVNVADGVKKKLDDIRGKLPEGMQLKVIYDQSLSIKTGISDLVKEGLTGAVLCFFVLLMFLGDWKSAGVVNTVIPTSIIITIIMLFASGITLNTISLAGLVVGVGLLTDGAIVIIENITRMKIEKKMPLFDAAVSGTVELVGAVTSSVGTTVVVFLPLVFVIGIIGQVFKDLSLAIVYTQIASLFVYFTLLPMLASRIKVSMPEVKEDNSHKENKFFHIFVKKNKILSKIYDKLLLIIWKTKVISRWTKTKYSKLLKWSFDNQVKTIKYAVIACVCSLVLLYFMPKELFPKVDSGQFLINLRMPVGTKLEVTNNTAIVIENELSKLQEVEHKTVTVGSVAKEGLQPLGVNEAQIVVDLKEERKRKQDEVIQDLKYGLDKLDLKGGKVLFSEQGGQFSVMGGGGSPVVVEIKGYDLKTLNKISDELRAALKEIKGIYNIDSSLKLNSMEIGIDINRDKLASYNLSVTDIARTVLTAIKGSVASKFREEGKEIDIRVRLSENDRKNQGSLHSLLITSPLKMDIPLQAVAKIDERLGPSEILHYDQQRTVLVSAGLFKRSIDNVKPDIEKTLQNLKKKYPDFSFDLTGEATQMADSFASLKIILLLSILLVYMIMAAQFESFWQPLLIMMTIPLSLIGMGPALLITGNSVSAMAGVGLVLLCGIVVNNGIVLIDFVNQERVRGVSLKVALWQACHIRLRPIMMTAFTTVLGLVPVAVGYGKEAQMQSPMAIVVISGFMVSTCLTLVVLPTLYLLAEEKLFKKKVD